MKVHLMYSDGDYDIKAEPCYEKDTLSADLELQRILANMAQEDKIIGAACSAALFCPLSSIEEIRYRQEILDDALRNPEAVRELYKITLETFEKKRRSWYWLSKSQNLSSVFSDAVGLLQIYTEMLMKMRNIADKCLTGFKSRGFTRFLTMLQKELDDDYFKKIRAHLEELKCADGMLISATLGSWNQGINYVLRRKNPKAFRRRWYFAPSFTIAPRDDAGATDLGVRRSRAINDSANALAQAAEHIESFITMLQGEIAFYVGCLNLGDTLRALDMPICIPDFLPQEQENRAWNTMYDVSLALTKNEAVIGNNHSAANKRLYIITGANQGGKSTFLRSIGQAQLMAQCGMFVGAESLSVPLRNGVFTHFKKEEDAAMKSGKLDEELLRMSALANSLKRNSLMLFNESFAATNEREGSEICRQITQALIDNGIEIFSVTHLYTYASAFLDNPNTEFLQAQRLDNGERTFRIIPGKPKQTAFGEDLYRKIFTVNQTKSL